MSSELDSLRQRIIELEAENAEVKAKYIKVMDENAEVKAENAKLRCALEEHEARFTRLEQRDKEKTNLISKMDDDIKEIKQSSANASSVENPTMLFAWRKSDSGLVTEIVQDLLQGFLVDNFQREFINTEFIDREYSNSSPVTEELVRLFHQASIASKNSIKAKQEEISSWGRYSERFEDKVIKLRSEDKNLKDKTARSQIYNEMKPYFSGISDEYLRKITSKVRKINKLFGYDYDPITLKKIKGIGWHMVNQVSDIQLIIKNSFSLYKVSDKVSDFGQGFGLVFRTFGFGHTLGKFRLQSHVTSEMITNDTTAPITLLSIGHITSEKIVNASQIIPAEVPAFSQPNVSLEMISSDMFQASVSSTSQSKPDHSYFCNKILDQYPNLYRECSSENFDYYGITDETSCRDYICPLCKLGHDDEEIEEDPRKYLYR
ncbi:hypothetical protein RhiirA4_449693 [Rhizophagus irregularis]|uniref:Uncharacterized protein n=2 Tax=Rhizophagus irregularis TaxID=588596 RepID=A0A2I1HNX1_9GLOM|nr:hypothetical protein RhiirA4_449693 [Rhizophagus irregularis]